MRKYVVTVALALMAIPATAQQAPQKDITLTFSPQEQKAVLDMMNEAVKARGLEMATAAAVIQQKMMKAAQAPAAPAPTPEKAK